MPTPKSDDDYIGSEAHFQDIVKNSWAARRANDEPAETLGEAAWRFKEACRQLWAALGWPRFAEKCLVFIGQNIAAAKRLEEIGQRLQIKQYVDVKIEAPALNQNDIEPPSPAIEATSWFMFPPFMAALEEVEKECAGKKGTEWDSVFLRACWRHGITFSTSLKDVVNVPLSHWIRAPLSAGNLWPEKSYLIWPHHA